MRKLFLIAATTLVAGCADNGASVETAATSDGLATALAGRTAGAPVTCVSMPSLRGNRSVGDAIVFDGPGDTIYVNRPGGGCPDLRNGRALQTNTYGSQLCRGDIVRVFDPGTGIEYGGCGLGDFTPYTRAN
jgi:hypothetical protein